MYLNNFSFKRPPFFFFCIKRFSTCTEFPFRPSSSVLLPQPLGEKRQLMFTDGFVLRSPFEKWALTVARPLCLLCSPSSRLPAVFTPPLLLEEDFFFLSAGQTFEVKQQSLISGFPLKMGYEPRINVVCRSCLTNGSAGTRERITNIKEAFANRYGGAAKLKVAPAVEGGLRLSRRPTGRILRLRWKFSLPSQIGPPVFMCVLLTSCATLPYCSFYFAQWHFATFT